MLDAMPSVAARRLAVRITKDALRQVRGGHPWVYAEAVTSVSDEGAEPGTLAVIFDDKRRFAAVGLWDPGSPIRVRVLHAGSPIPVDETFWLAAIERAASMRSALAAGGTTGYRLLHGENDGFGGLIVDRYDDTLVVKVYSAAWLPHLRSVVAMLIDHAQPESVVLRLGRRLGKSREARDLGLVDGVVIYGRDVDGPVMFVENGLTFEADVLAGAKTGHFLDQRDNRQLVRGLSQGLDVLDVFCATGGFSVYAAAGEARTVHSVDRSGVALDTAIRNMAHNSTVAAGTDHRTTEGDAFEVMESLKRNAESYDVVVIDPPSFTPRAADRSRALRSYRRLTDLALPLLRSPGRLLQASCSSHVTEDDLLTTVMAAIDQSHFAVVESAVFGHAIDHPVTFPQGRYLNAAFLALRKR